VVLADIKRGGTGRDLDTVTLEETKLEANAAD
jgi:hypothetical protein